MSKAIQKVRAVFSFARMSESGIQIQKNSEAGEVLLSREANRSTIGAGGLNFRVRHGTGWTPSAILTCFHCSIKTGKTFLRSLYSPQQLVTTLPCPLRFRISSARDFEQNGS